MEENERGKGKKRKKGWMKGREKGWRGRKGRGRLRHGFGGDGRPWATTRCTDTSSHAIVPWVQTLRPIEGRGDGGGVAAACDWLVGGGYGTPIDARVAQCKNCHNLCDVLL